LEDALVDAIEVGARLADDGGVDDGGERLQVGDDNMVEQRLVVARQLRQNLQNP